MAPIGPGFAVGLFLRLKITPLSEFGRLAVAGPAAALYATGPE